MTDPTQVAVGVPAALVGAACFGVASVLQHRAARRAPARAPGEPRLFIDLLHQPRFRWSVVLTAVGFGLQVVALKLIPLILVEPLLVTGLLWFVVLAARLGHHRPDPGLILASLGALASLSVFLLLARPKQGVGHGIRDLGTVLPLAIVLAIIVAACVLSAVAIGQRWRSLTLALASGICYGVTAGLIRALTPFFSQGLIVILTRWETYAVIVIGQFGVLLSQNAYQAGKIGSPALTVMTVTDPLVSIAVGRLWLGEQMRTATPYAIGEAVALVALIGCVYLVTARAPHRRRPTTDPPHSGSHPASRTARGKSA